MRLPSVIVVSTVVLLAAPAAARPFGAKGEYIVTSDARVDLQRTTTEIEGVDRDVTATDYAFRLAGDYSRFDNVTFGIQVGFEGTVVGDDAEKGFRFGARAGYVVPLTPVTSLWPRLGVSYGNTSYQSVTTQFTVSSVRLSASLPVVFNPYPQIIVGLSPSYERDLSAKSGINDDSPVPKSSSYGVSLLLGFWFE